ncbi:MAG: hypothetical protein P9L92_12200 [Candidatus Electryonea clarkiae]|nr:hypothetical protein [Candidatus Electryonea clarkiae]MDP8289099.1 hypothetical protein [Candidatus Electryonea clarkiae]
MATTEPTINDALALVLRETRMLWRASNAVRSENTGLLKGTSGRPDILISEPHVSPVIIESELHPAATVEEDALSRLGKELSSNGQKITSVIAIRYPRRFRDVPSHELTERIRLATDIESALLSGESNREFSRWPRRGWIQVDVTQLSLLVQWASVAPHVINRAVDELFSGVSEAAALLEEMHNHNEAALQRISKELCQEDSEQTRRMAMTILANALVFHETLAGSVGELGKVLSLEELRGTERGLTKSSILAEWRKIIKVNYWPIFDIARRILQEVPTARSRAIIGRLANTAIALVEDNLMRSHDLTGAVFQRLIADRKFLAAFYTTPPSAALLVGLCLSDNFMSDGKSWSNPDDVKGQLIADFACGTGTLLSTAYQRIGQLHEIAGGSANDIHSEMMASSIVGCDVLPAAAHLTASMLAGSHPTVYYDQSSILTLGYGKQESGSVALGSINLLSDQGDLEITSVMAKSAGGKKETEVETWQSLPSLHFDLVIMNPPFTRPTNHEGKSKNVPNPMFAAFGSSAEEQKVMAKATKALTIGSSAHGNAGEASIFMALADKKLKLGGWLALVMPLSLMIGLSWERSRQLLTKNYTDLLLVSISGSAKGPMSFSADTGMAECLVVGRKKGGGNLRATFVILNDTPDYPIVGAGIADQINRLKQEGAIRKLEDGPLGGTAIAFGDDVVGYVMDAPLPPSGGWRVARIADLSLAQTAYQLKNEHCIWLPSMTHKQSTHVPIAAVGSIGSIGPVDRDINGMNPDRSIRGPFNVTELQPGRVPTYPILWAHDASREHTMVFAADSEGVERQGKNILSVQSIENKAKTIWETASHCHFNRDFQFNSQSTAMQFTPVRTIGGRAWISISLPSADQEKALVAWGNTTLGLLLHWWQANKQQRGRGTISKQPLAEFSTLDVLSLTPEKLKCAAVVFDEFSTRMLCPINEINEDSTRAELDARFLVDVLDVPEKVVEPGGPLALLRQKLAAEPSIHGHKGNPNSKSV